MTPITPRDRDTIRRDLLGRLAARHRLYRHEELDVREGSSAWLRASALSVLLESMERQAAGAPRQVHPDAAAGAHLVDHGTAADLPRASGESEGDYRERVVAWWRERFTSLSPEDLRDLVESHPLVTEAYVYPRRPPEGGLPAIGCATVIALGPPRGDSLAQTRILSSTDVDHVNAWLQGAEDEHGNAASDPERRIVCAHPDSVKVNAAAGDAGAFVIPIKNADTHPFPFSGTLSFVSTLGLTITVSGDHTDKVGLPMLVGFGGTVVFGNYARCVPTSAVFGGVNTVLTFDSLPGTPTSSTLYPCPPNFEAIRDRVAAYVDQLTPYAFPGTYPSRFPDISPPRVDRLYLAPVIRTVLGVEGVTEVALTFVTPAPSGDLWLFDELLVTEAP